ncbi:hypothetical protein M8J77_010327 [Diaphorina citri]|nr:hypothetical protein M8J77_010327 [Diaphorina citri]
MKKKKKKKIEVVTSEQTLRKNIGVLLVSCSRANNNSGDTVESPMYRGFSSRPRYNPYQPGPRPFRNGFQNYDWNQPTPYFRRYQEFKDDIPSHQVPKFNNRFRRSASVGRESVNFHRSASVGRESVNFHRSASVGRESVNFHRSASVDRESVNFHRSASVGRESVNFHRSASVGWESVNFRRSSSAGRESVSFRSGLSESTGSLQHFSLSPGRNKATSTTMEQKSNRVSHLTKQMDTKQMSPLVKESSNVTSKKPDRTDASPVQGTSQTTQGSEMTSPGTSTTKRKQDQTLSIVTKRARITFDDESDSLRVDPVDGTQSPSPPILNRPRIIRPDVTHSPTGRSPPLRQGASYLHTSDRITGDGYQHNRDLRYKVSPKFNYNNRRNQTPYRDRASYHGKRRVPFIAIFHGHDFSTSTH